MRRSSFTQRVLALFIILFVGNIVSTTLHAQVTIGSSEEPNAGAILDLKENGNKGVNSTKGLLLPRMELSSLKSMQPIFDDAKLTDEIRQSHIGLTIFNTKTDYPLGLCKGVYTWSGDFEWKRLPEPCCLGLANIEVANTVLNYMEDDVPNFTADITPKESTTPITYEWYIDNNLIVSTQNDTIPIPIKREYNGKDIFVKAYNQCTVSPVISDKKTLIIDTKCDPVTSAEIVGADRLFKDGESVLFTANVTPNNPTSPVTFKWYLDEELVFETVDDNDVVADMEYAYNGKSLRVEVTSCDQTVKSNAQTLRVCLPMEEVVIENMVVEGEGKGSGKKNFAFRYGTSVLFRPFISPINDSQAINCEWTYKGETVYGDTILLEGLDPDDNEKILYLKVKNQCGETISTQETIYTYDCIDMKDNQRINLEGGGEGTPTTGRSQWTFIISDLENFTQEQLTQMGVTIQWYYTNNGWSGPTEYALIPEATNSYRFTLDINDSRFNNGTIHVGFVVKGSANVFDCPMTNDKSNGVFSLLVQGTAVARPTFIHPDQPGNAINQTYLQKWLNFAPR